MNNWGKSNLELTPAPEMTMIDESGMLSVLIKHDYFSSDTEHGKYLLGIVLDSLIECGDSFSKILLVDSSVGLLDDDAFSSRLEKLFRLSHYSYICEESLSSFGVEYSSHDNVIVCPASDISMELIQTNHLITLD